MQIERYEVPDSGSNGTRVPVMRTRGAACGSAALRRTPPEGADLQRVDLRSANLERASLRYAKLDGADLTHANLAGADLTRAELRDAKLEGARLARATLVEANLRNADLRDADLGDADVGGAQLSGADLRGAMLVTPTLAEANLHRACYDDRTRLPEGFDAIGAGMEREDAARRKPLGNTARRRIRARAFIKVWNGQPVIVMDVTGPVCAETAGYVRDRFEQALWVSRASAPFLLNFDSACRLDADGMEALVSIDKTAKRAGVRVGFVVPDRFCVAAPDPRFFSSIACFDNAKDAIEYATATAPARFSRNVGGVAIPATGLDTHAPAVPQ